MAESDISDSEYVPPGNMPDFEFLEIDHSANNEEDQNASNAEDNMEFAFPLFSSNSVSNPDKEEGEDLRQQILVSLRDANEDIDELILNHNKMICDRKYGRIVYTSNELENFKSMAVDFDLIFTNATRYNDKKSNSVVELLSENSTSDLKIKSKKRKLGQRQRKAKKLGIERELERKKQDADVKKMIKKKFHKRGGKRNSAKPKQVNKVMKFRTE